MGPNRPVPCSSRHPRHPWLPRWSWQVPEATRQAQGDPGACPASLSLSFRSVQGQRGYSHLPGTRAGTWAGLLLATSVGPVGRAGLRPPPGLLSSPLPSHQLSLPDCGVPEHRRAWSGVHPAQPQRTQGPISGLRKWAPGTCPETCLGHTRHTLGTRAGDSRLPGPRQDRAGAGLCGMEVRGGGRALGPRGTLCPCALLWARPCVWSAPPELGPCTSRRPLLGPTQGEGACRTRGRRGLARHRCEQTPCAPEPAPLLVLRGTELVGRLSGPSGPGRQDVCSEPVSRCWPLRTPTRGRAQGETPRRLTCHAPRSASPLQARGCIWAAPDAPRLSLPRAQRAGARAGHVS